MEALPEPPLYEEGTHGANSRFTDGKALNAICGIKKGCYAGALIRLVKGSYFQKLHAENKIIQRRQDLPKEAFWDREITRRTIIVVLSYPWITKGHPDPNGFHLKTLGPMFAHFHNYQLDVVAKVKNKTYEGDVAVFMDFTCLFQERREQWERESFNSSLEIMTMLYAHARTMKWCLTETPEGVHPYDKRGWCKFEFHIASMITTSRRLLKFGEVGIEPDLVEDFEEEVENRLKQTRRPPILPEEFERMLLERNRSGYLYSFTNGTDRSFVIRKYNEVVRELFSEVDRLEFDGLGWTDSDMEELLRFFPLCWRLTSLYLRNNQLTDEGARQLARCLPNSVVTIDLTGNSNLSLPFNEPDPVKGKTWNKKMPKKEKDQRLEWRKRYFNAFCNYYKNDSHSQDEHDKRH